MKPEFQPQTPFPPEVQSHAPSAEHGTSTQKQSTNCTNSTNSSISEIREISGCSQKTIGEIRKISGPAPKISVIVPVYKVEKYLPECIESVLAQTFTDFELILVDDGSPDNSGAICDAYAARDPRVRVFHKENGGVSSARNLGARNSRAEYITFLDSDDIFLSNALKIFVDAIKCDPFASIWCSNFFKSGKNGCYLFLRNLQTGRIENPYKLFFERIFFSRMGSFMIRKTDFLKHSGFDENIKIYEDLDFLFRFFSEPVYFSNTATMIYREEFASASITHRPASQSWCGKIRIKTCHDKFGRKVLAEHILISSREYIKRKDFKDALQILVPNLWNLSIYNLIFQKIFKN